MYFSLCTYFQVEVLHVKCVGGRRKKEIENVVLGEHQEAQVCIFLLTTMDI